MVAPIGAGDVMSGTPQGGLYASHWHAHRGGMPMPTRGPRRVEHLLPFS
jgi:hypothetical protein